jgi:hypothetical protein
MKLNPYAVLLVTGALMLATVVLAQLGSGVTLLAEGAKSIDTDISGFTATALSRPGPDRPARVDGQGMQVEPRTEKYAAIDSHNGTPRAR